MKDMNAGLMTLVARYLEALPDSTDLADDVATFFRAGEKGKLSQDIANMVAEAVQDVIYSVAADLKAKAQAKRQVVRKRRDLIINIGKAAGTTLTLTEIRNIQIELDKIDRGSE